MNPLVSVIIPSLSEGDRKRALAQLGFVLRHNPAHLRHLLRLDVLPGK